MAVGLAVGWACSNDAGRPGTAEGSQPCLTSEGGARVPSSWEMFRAGTDVHRPTVGELGCWMPGAILVLAGSALILGLAAKPAWGG